MGLAKEDWLKQQHENPNNWVTKTCPNCGETFKVNYVTKPMKDAELAWCDDCFNKFILGMK